MNSWSIVDSVYLYTSWDGKKVCIANPESKKYWGPVQKISESVKDPESIPNTGSRIKITDGKVYLEINGKYLLVSNLLEEGLLLQLSEATLSGGEANGVVFGFSPLFPDKVVMMFPGSKLYQEAEDEYLRKTSLSIHKKTTKYIPGHKYETEDGAFWYIGEFKTHRGTVSDYWDHKFDPQKANKVYVFSNYLPPSKKVSDVYKECEVLRAIQIKGCEFSSYPKTVIFTAKNPGMVDYGEELELDVTVGEGQKLRVQEYVNSYKTPYTFGSSRTYYKEISWMFELFDLFDPGKLEVIPQEVRDQVKDVITTNLKRFLFLHKTDNGDNTKDIISRFKESLGPVSSGYYRNDDYLFGMLEKLFGINISSVAQNVVSSWIDLIPSELEDFAENIGYYEFREENNFRKTVDLVYVSKEYKKISKYLPDCDYRDMMVDIYKKALESNGGNLEKFTVDNTGTSRTPNLRYTFTVTFKDILNHYKVKSLEDLPSGIKKDIADLKIYELTFVTKDDVII